MFMFDKYPGHAAMKHCDKTKAWIAADLRETPFYVVKSDSTIAYALLTNVNYCHP